MTMAHLIDRLKNGAAILLLIVLVFLTPSLAPLWVLVILNLLIKESFPFSHFPMYSKFSKFTYYIFITDETGEPIPMRDNFGIRPTFLKKIYITEVKLANPGGLPMTALPETVLNRAGLALLERVRQFPKSREIAAGKFRKLRLYQMNLYLENGTIRREKRFIAEAAV